MAQPDTAARQCTATAKSTGKRCTQPPIHGGNVCRYHGGAAPQVIKKARERLADLVDPAIGRLRVLVDTEDERVALAAAKDILDRNDFTGKAKREITGADGEPLKFTFTIQPGDDSDDSD